jgi:hypothetical protein
MNRWVIVLLFLLSAKVSLAQKDKDSIVYKMPVVNDELIYEDSVEVKGNSKARLDSLAKKWLGTYFKYYQRDTLSKDKDAKSSILSQTAVEFRIATSSLGMVKYKFYFVTTIKDNCRDNNYTYKFFDMYYTPKSDFFRSMGYYQSSPDYLIGLYRKKHLGLGPSINLGRKKIMEYFTYTNNAVLECIASLNKAMAN